MKKRKIILFALGGLIISLLALELSYALWQITKVQEGTNIVTTACFEVTFEDKNNIGLPNAYPITDEEGFALVPYTFTLTNKCSENIDYVINLETVSEGEKILPEKYLKASLMKDDKSLFFDQLTDNHVNLEQVIPEASKAFFLYQGTLNGNEALSFDLRLWLDEKTEAKDEVMNAIYRGKITVSSSYKLNDKNKMVPLDIDASNLGTVDTILLNHTYTQQEKYSLSKIVFESTLNPIDTATEVVDFSEAQDKTVLGYYVADTPEEDTRYTLHIQADGKIVANENADFYFAAVGDVSGYGSNPMTVFEGIENVDFSKAKSIAGLFAFSSFDTLDLSLFDFSNVENIAYSGSPTGMSVLRQSKVNKVYFSSAPKFSTSILVKIFDFSYIKELDLTNVNTAGVTDMSYMFYRMTYLTKLILGDQFNTSSVTNMSNMFAYLLNLTELDLSRFDTSNVTDMSGMFSGMSGLTSLDISNLDTSNVISMEDMFRRTGLTTLDVSSFDTTSVTNMSSMFSNMDKLTSLTFGANFDTSNVTDMSGMFSQLPNLPSLDLSSFDTSSVTDMNHMFSNIYLLDTLVFGPKFSTSKVTDMESMFESSRFTNLDLSQFDTRNVTNMKRMFDRASSLTSLNLSSLDTSNVTNMSCMFCGVSSITSLDISNFDTTSVTDMSYMFEEMSGLTSLNLSHFVTSSVTDMRGMFGNMTNVSSLDISQFDTSNVTNMSSMFTSMKALTNLDLRHFNTKSVTNMNSMFSKMSLLSDLKFGESFTTSNVTQMESMFSEMTSLTSLDLSTFDTSKVKYMSSMFMNDSNLSHITYGNNFVYGSSPRTGDMFKNCPANKPDHESWSSVSW